MIDELWEPYGVGDSLIVSVIYDSGDETKLCTIEGEGEIEGVFRVVL